MITRRSKRRRRSERGVALVEAGVLAPIFAMMMMMTVYLGGVYQTKYQSFLDARNGTWSYVSNSCQGDGDHAEPAMDPNMPSTNVGQGGQASGESESNASLFIGHSKTSRTWDYAPTYRFNNPSGPKTITTEGWAVCNESKYGGNVFSYLPGIIGQVAHF